MAGGLMQLVAYGAQDVYLTGNPKVTFFQAVYKRHTNFAMECIQQTVNGTAANSGRLSVTIARNGDLIGDMFLDITTSALNVGTREGDLSSISGNWVAERAILAIELSIGGQRIDKHYQRWWRLYSELYLTESKKQAWGKLTTDPTGQGSQQVYLPLIFFFNRNPGLYLPLIALQYHEVRLDIDLAANYAAYFGTNVPNVWGNYVYLDTEERRRFAQKGHEYLIEQVQHTGTDQVTGQVAAGGTKQVRLSYNHPVKELVWCLCGADTTNARMWNFTTNVDTSNAVVLESNPDFASIRGMSNVYFLTSPSASCGTPMYLSGNVVAGAAQSGAAFGVATGVSPASSICQWSEDGLPYIERSSGPLSTFKLILNGQDRFKAQSGKFFNQMQPMWHHSGNPYPGVYCYSFALKPEELQPTGTCNFSRIDNSQVEIVTKSNTFNTSTLAMFAVNYNVLRIQSGMGGLAFSN